MTGPQENVWVAAVRANPDHPRQYAERWRRFAEQGRDLDGEARLLDAMADRGSRILDAGCGTGRVGGYLAARGHEVVGVDLDPHLIDVARAEHPAGVWHVGDLAELDLQTETAERALFDLAVCAGNVMTFLAGEERRPALRRVREHMAPGGRFVVGFGAGRGYGFEEFLADAAAEGWSLQGQYSTWQLHPVGEGADFLVAVLGAGGAAR